MVTTMQRAILERGIERQDWLDGVGDAVANAWDAGLRRLGPREQAVRDFLNGTWLGHPVHPAVTDLPIGSWSMAVVLDLAGQRRAADIAVGTGIAGAAMAALAGLADWRHTSGGTRRTGVVHALTNSTALTLYGASLVQRLRGRRASGVGLSGAGFLAVLAGAWLGGELAYRLGVRVNRNAWTEGPREFVSVMNEADLPENRPTKVEVNGADVVLVKTGGRIHALEDTCSHQGGPLSGGRLQDGTIVCPWHASTYSLEDGTVIHGPSSYAQPVYEARVVDGRVEVRLASRQR